MHGKPFSGIKAGLFSGLAAFLFACMLCLAMGANSNAFAADESADADAEAVANISEETGVAAEASFEAAAAVAADESDEVPGMVEFTDLASKTAEPTGEKNEYQVTVSVPGSEESAATEIIMMVDGSDSQNDSGTPNFENLISSIRELGSKVLTDEGTVTLTLMGFGFSPTTAFSVTTPEELEEILATITQDDFLYGVSATNCEAAFAYISNYLKDREDLENAFVFFTSDGQTNMDEELFDWTEWQTTPAWWYSACRPKGAETVEQALTRMMQQMIAPEEANAIADGYNVFPATEAMFPDEVAALYAAVESGNQEQIIHCVGALNNAIVANAAAWSNAVWSDVFTAAGMSYTKGCQYSSSQVETAFVDYIRANLDNPTLGGYQSLILYIPVYGMSTHYADYYKPSGGKAARTTGQRAAAACDELGNLDVVKAIYLIGYPGRAGIKTADYWMNPEATDATTDVKVTSEKASYFDSEDFASALEAIADMGDYVTKTIYNDAVVTDPMSDYVELDEASICVYRNGELIYDASQGGWLTEDIPTSDAPTVGIDPASGNKMITWKVKDGALRATDAFSLTYTVKLLPDKANDSEKTYPLNDPTSISYADPTGIPQEEDIDVPEVPGIGGDDDPIVDPDDEGDDDDDFTDDDAIDDDAFEGDDDTATSPQTGDNAPLLPFALISVAALCMLGISFRRMRRA